MKTVHILNPAAGQGKALKFKDRSNVYVTKGVGDATEYVKTLLEDASEEIDFKVYGGDGTVNEVIGGIMRSGSDKAYISIVPTGTGNDLVRSIEGKTDDVINADVLTLGDGYAINAINTGFDLEVVLKAAEYKKLPFVSGTLAYILGIVSVFTKKMGKRLSIEYTDESGKTDRFEGECLLVLAGNGSYYGGGFMASPAADITDGFIDLLIVKKVSRLKFLSVVAKYKKGKHIDVVKKSPLDKFEDILIFKKCKRVIIDGIDKICADGEVFKSARAEVGIIPGAVRIVKKQAVEALV